MLMSRFGGWLLYARQHEYRAFFMDGLNVKLNINPRFEKLLAPLTDEEFAELEKAILEEGRIRDAIVLMSGDVIVDGHNRWALYQKHRDKLPEPQVIIKRFDSEEAAELWIIRNQLGRRSIDKRTRTELVGRLYQAVKKSVGRPQTEGENKLGQNDPISETSEKQEPKRSSEQVAAQTGDSEATVRRAGKYAEALDLLPETLANAIRKRPNIATERAVIKLAGLPATKHHEFARDLRTGVTTNLDEWLGLKKGKPKPAEEAAASDAEQVEKEEVSASVVLDDLDRDVPKRLRPFYDGGAQVLSVAKAVAAAKRELAKLVNGDAMVAGAEWVEAQRLTRELDSVRRELTQATYYTECPKCRGKVRENCDRCKGFGYIPKRAKRLLSEAEQAWLST